MLKKHGMLKNFHLSILSVSYPLAVPINTKYGDYKLQY